MVTEEGFMLDLFEFSLLHHTCCAVVSLTGVS